MVLPVALALVGAILDGGWALHQAALVSAAAEAAQRAVAGQDTGAGHCAGGPPDAYAGLSKAAAAAAAPTLNPSDISVAVRYLEPACTGRMRTLIVDVTYPLRALTPWFTGLLNGRRVTAEAATAVEEVAPAWWGSADRVLAQQTEIASQQSALSTQQVQIAALQSQLGSDEAQIAGNQLQIASQQSQLESLAASYQAAVSAYQTASSAYQAEVSLATLLSQAAAYYYTQWQQLAGQGGVDGTHEQ